MLARHAETTKDSAHDAAPPRGAGPAVQMGQLASLVGALGYILLLVVLLAWWAALAIPAYLCGLAVLLLTLGRSRIAAPFRPVLAVALTTASMSVLVGLIKLAGLA